MASEGGTYILPSDAQILFDLYDDIYGITGGLFTPLIGQTLVDAGYDSEYTLKRKDQIYKPEEWGEIIEYDFPRIIFDKPALLDFGAAGKGYLVDIISEILEDYQIRNYCVDGSGDIRFRNTNHIPIKVGLENPNDPNQVIGVTELINESICGSATNRRKWDKFNHVINPKTLESSQSIIATWVKAKTTILADALSTCLFFCKPFKLKQYYDFEYIILNADFSVEKSADLNAQLFTKEESKV